MKKDNLKVVIGLDLSSMDNFLIDYINVLNHILDIDKVTYMHNIKLGELPKELLAPEKINVIQERVKQRITEQIIASQVTYTFEVIVTYENYTEVAFAHYYKTNPFNLLVLGNKQELEGNGALSHKLIRILPAATLLVPETFKTPITTIIDAIDFTKYTPIIMAWADRFKNNSKGQKIQHSAVYISKFHWGFYQTTDKEWEKATQEDIAQKQQKWNKQYASYSDIEIISAEDRSVSTSLIAYAKKKKADLMILGVKGSTTIKEVFLGSVANHILQRPTNTCLLFVKNIK